MASVAPANGRKASKGRLSAAGEDQSHVGLLDALSSEVEKMSSVFEEANKARDEYRKRLQEVHQDTMRQIQMTRDHMVQKSKHVQDTMKSFTAKFDHDIVGMKTDLRGELSAKSARVEGVIQDLDQRTTELEAGLAEQTQERIRLTKTLLGPIQEQVEQIMADLENERQTRRRREEELTKRLSDETGEINRKLDAEKFSREQQYMAFSRWSDEEHSELSKRQYTAEGEIKDTTMSLFHELKAETKDRIECQGGKDGIVESIASFVKKFQEQLSKDSSSAAAHEERTRSKLGKEGDKTNPKVQAAAKADEGEEDEEEEDGDEAEDAGGGDEN